MAIPDSDASLDRKLVANTVALAAYRAYTGNTLRWDIPADAAFYAGWRAALAIWQNSFKTESN